MNRRPSPENLAKLLVIPDSRSVEAVLKAQLIAAVAREIELRGITHAELATRSGLPRSAVTGIPFRKSPEGDDRACAAPRRLRRPGC
jgi:hypothetical protein